VIWFDDRYVGSQLDNPSFAEIAKAMKCESIKVDHVDQVGGAMKEALKMQESGKTCLVEMMMSKEIDDPFRRDAMKMPHRILDKYKKFESPNENIMG
jgi:sulfoacetaldehyde acetyltransferase